MTLIYENLFCPHEKEAGALTIGFFDGMHKGHKKLLQTVKKSSSGKSAVVTFGNHPLAYFTQKEVGLISSRSQRLHLLEKEGIDLIYILPFDKALSEKTYSTFLREIRQKFPCKKLILGKGSTFGKNREGTPEKVKSFAQKEGFEALYIDLQKEEEVISSSLIRSFLQNKEMAKAEKLLQRPFTLYLQKILSISEEKMVFTLEDLPALPEGEYSFTISSLSCKGKLFYQKKQVEMKPLPFALSPPFELILTN